MCTKILLSQLEQLQWDGQSAMASADWKLSFRVQPWTKGLSVVLSLQALRLPEGGDYLGRMLFRDGSDRTIVLRRGQEAKLIRNMLQMWPIKQWVVMHYQPMKAVRDHLLLGCPCCQPGVLMMMFVDRARKIGRVNEDVLNLVRWVAEGRPGKLTRRAHREMLALKAVVAVQTS